MLKNVILLFLALLILYAPQPIHAAVCVNKISGEIDPNAPQPCPPTHTSVATLKDFEGIFSNLVSISGILLGFAFFLMMIVGGVRYLFSGGDPKALQSAKGTITWGIIGLALFALSFTILLIIQAFTGVNVTIFSITI